MNSRNKFALALAAVPLLAVGKGDIAREVKDPVEISRIVHGVPAFRADLGARLSAGGMGVSGIYIRPITREDVAEDPMHVAPGDVEIHIYTTGDPDAGGCRILGNPTILKRGNRYIAEDRTGWWLLKGNCDYPG
ncbi:hypothetical protein [Caballeronia sp. Lep1P3]|uniref:hypothetical protein n=1 Tax=Caballeronia sp. Lep1P3 TaxID=2878150 RepID=UPI001FD2DB6D|nr:hypothetical protein [Caballeronia sp. Lep1P3]